MADSGLSFAICLRLQHLTASASDQLEDRSTPAEIGGAGNSPDRDRQTVHEANDRCKTARRDK